MRSWPSRHAPHGRVAAQASPMLAPNTTSRHGCREGHNNGNPLPGAVPIKANSTTRNARSAKWLRDPA